YAYFRLAADTAKEAVHICKEIGINAANITAPFKTDIVPFSTQLSPEVQKLKICNSLVFEGDTICAYNTDIDGVLGTLQEANLNLKNLPCLVLGAGGAGSAAAYALHNAEAKVTIVNRNPHKARNVAKAIGCQSISTTDIEKHLQKIRLIVNTIGEHHNLISSHWLTTKHIFFDAVYHHSQFKELTAQKGCQFIDGSHWLLHQSFPAYLRFTGLEPNVKAMQGIFTEQKMPKHIALIGFMGAGKSTVAPLLAQQMNLPTVDIDVEIERHCGMTIPLLIEKKGEQYFRQQEQIVLEEVLARPKCHIISCGGGVIAQSSLAQQLKEQSIVIWIYASPNICLKRIDINSRPLLAQHANPLQAAKALFHKRKFVYAQTAYLLVNANNNSAKIVSNKIYDEINTLFPH
ncbi:MAG: shikimate kinase, partial [Bacteroidales bacterium]